MASSIDKWGFRLGVWLNIMNVLTVVIGAEIGELCIISHLIS